MTWADGRRLTHTSKGLVSVDYTYDGDGLRTERRVNYDTVYRYVYSGGALLRIERTTEDGNTDCIDFLYDGQGAIGFVYSDSVANSQIYYFLIGYGGDIDGVMDRDGNILVRYVYDAWGNFTETFQTNDAADLTALSLNPLRYRGYVYDAETGFYYLQSRYYDPEVGRFINTDGQMSGVGGDLRGYNLFSYCFNDPINMADENGAWPKWLEGTLNVISGGLQMAAGAAIGAMAGWTGVGAVAGTVLAVNGAATIAQGVGQIVNDTTDSNVLCEDNIVKTGFEEVGEAIAGEAGAMVAGGIYDALVFAASLYASVTSVKQVLQQAGTIPVKVPLSSVYNNPLDDFVKIGPANGKISDYCYSIPRKGYGRITVTQLPNGLYQIVDGHHRVQALRNLGYSLIKVFLK